MGGQRSFVNLSIFATGRGVDGLTHVVGSPNVNALVAWIIASDGGSKMKLASKARVAALFTFLAGAGGAACGGGGASGPDGTKTPQVPFGTHPLAYMGGVLHPSGTQAALDDAVRDKYQAWKKTYLIKGCGGYYVCANEVSGSCADDGAALVAAGGKGADGVDLDMEMTVSEGHGYGMLIAALMAGLEPDARTIFDGFVTFRDKYRSPYDVNLMSWKINAGCMPPEASDNDAATDGDLDSAFAFLLAEKQ